MMLTKFQVDKLVGKVICIEGNVGTGKEDFSKSFCSYIANMGHSVRLYYDKIDIHILRNYLNNKEKMAYQYQCMKLNIVASMMAQAREFANNGGISVINKGLLTCFAYTLNDYSKNIISIKDYIEYENFLSYIISNVNMPDYTIYLMTNIRTIKRNIMISFVFSEVYFYSDDLLTSIEYSFIKAIEKLKYQTIPFYYEDRLNYEYVYQKFIEKVFLQK
jgi:archaellum biogenesis ATPase FlaH